MKGFCILLSVALCSGLLAQDREFKSFYAEGKTLMEQQRYTEAVEQFNAAYQLEKEPQRYRQDGNFFDFYMPRYMLALCYEHIDILIADEWAVRSKEAVEDNLIEKKKKELSDYRKDMERIHAGAEKRRGELRSAYDLKLTEARGYLNNNRFEEATRAFEALSKLDPDRTEARAGMASIADKRATYLDRLSLDVARALLAKDWKAAETAIAEYGRVDAGSTKIALLQKDLADAREQVRLASLPKKEDPVTPVRNDPPRQSNPVRNDPPRNTSADADRRAREAAAAVKRTVRAGLLESIAAYRRGDPAAALSRLEQIDAGDGAAFGSYHWLKGVYLLSMYTLGGEKEAGLRDKAGVAMAETARLLPEFKPEQKLYPDFVLEFYASLSP